VKAGIGEGNERRKSRKEKIKSSFGRRRCFLLPSSPQSLSLLLLLLLNQTTLLTLSPTASALTRRAAPRREATETLRRACCESERGEKREIEVEFLNWCRSLSLSLASLLCPTANELVSSPRRVEEERTGREAAAGREQPRATSEEERAKAMVFFLLASKREERQERTKRNDLTRPASEEKTKTKKKSETAFFPRPLASHLLPLFSLQQTPPTHIPRPWPLHRDREITSGPGRSCATAGSDCRCERRRSAPRRPRRQVLCPDAPRFRVVSRCLASRWGTS
jgi:hypothetical protein